MFEDKRAFKPEVDSKIPLSRHPLVLVVRGLATVIELFFSRHPGDLVTWIRSMVARRRPLSLPIPWLTFGAIRSINAVLDQSWTVFEYGAGHSTIYWATRGIQVASVEDSKDWFDLLNKKLSEMGASQVRVMHRVNKDEYVGAINSAGFSHFDMVLVDGAFRRECVVAAVEHIKPGGYLVVDNTDWHWVQDFPYEGIPDGWVKAVFHGFAPMLGHRSETTVWRRPPSA